MESWVNANHGVFERATALFEGLKNSVPLNLAMLALANRQMRELIVA